MTFARSGLALAALIGSCFLAGCDIEVRDNGHDNADVDVRTPLGALSVQGGVNVQAMELPVYPGAQPLIDDDDDGDQATVRIRSPFFDMDLQAARFESQAAPAEIIAFYKRELNAFGRVVECQGDIDFKHRRDPVCRERRRSRETQLAVGTDERHRMVVVKPRRGSVEFAVMSIATDVLSD